MDIKLRNCFLYAALLWAVALPCAYTQELEANFPANPNSFSEGLEKSLTRNFQTLNEAMTQQTNLGHELEGEQKEILATFGTAQDVQQQQQAISASLGRAAAYFDQIRGSTDQIKVGMSRYEKAADQEMERIHNQEVTIAQNEPLLEEQLKQPQLQPSPQPEQVQPQQLQPQLQPPSQPQELQSQQHQLQPKLQKQQGRVQSPPGSKPMQQQHQLQLPPEPKVPQSRQQRANSLGAQFATTTANSLEAQFENFKDVDDQQKVIDQNVAIMNDQANADERDMEHSLDRIEKMLDSPPPVAAEAAKNTVPVKQHDKEPGAGYRPNFSGPCPVVQHQKQPGDSNCTPGVVFQPEVHASIPEVRYTKLAGEKEVIPEVHGTDHLMTPGNNNRVVAPATPALPAQNVIPSQIHKKVPSSEAAPRQNAIPSHQYDKKAGVAAYNSKDPCKVVQHGKQPGSSNCTSEVVIPTASNRPGIPEVRYNKLAGSDSASVQNMLKPTNNATKEVSQNQIVKGTTDSTNEVVKRTSQNQSSSGTKDSSTNEIVKLMFQNHSSKGTNAVLNNVSQNRSWKDISHASDLKTESAANNLTPKWKVVQPGLKVKTVTPKMPGVQNIKAVGNNNVTFSRVPVAHNTYLPGAQSMYKVIKVHTKHPAGHHPEPKGSAITNANLTLNSTLNSGKFGKWPLRVKITAYNGTLPRPFPQTLGTSSEAPQKPVPQTPVESIQSAAQKIQSVAKAIQSEAGNATTNISYGHDRANHTGKSEPAIKKSRGHHGKSRTSAHKHASSQKRKLAVHKRSANHTAKSETIKKPHGHHQTNRTSAHKHASSHNRTRAAHMGSANKTQKVPRTNGTESKLNTSTGPLNTSQHHAAFQSTASTQEKKTQLTHVETVDNITRAILKQSNLTEDKARILAPLVVDLEKRLLSVERKEKEAEQIEKQLDDKEDSITKRLHGKAGDKGAESAEKLMVYLTRKTRRAFKKKQAQWKTTKKAFRDAIGAVKNANVIKLQSAMKRLDQVLQQKDSEDSDNADRLEQTPKPKVFHHGHLHHVHKDKMTTIYRPKLHQNHSRPAVPGSAPSGNQPGAKAEVPEHEELAKELTKEKLHLKTLNPKAKHPRAVVVHSHVQAHAHRTRRSGKIRMLNGRARNNEPIRTP